MVVRYSLKRIVEETFEVTADIFKEGHDTIVGIFRYNTHCKKHWHETPMHHVDNDQCAGSFRSLASPSLLHPLTFVQTHGNLQIPVLVVSAS